MLKYIYILAYFFYLVFMNWFNESTSSVIERESIIDNKEKNIDVLSSSKKLETINNLEFFCEDWGLEWFNDIKDLLLKFPDFLLRLWNILKNSDDSIKEQLFMFFEENWIINFSNIQWDIQIDKDYLKNFNSIFNLEKSNLLRDNMVLFTRDLKLNEENLNQFLAYFSNKNESIDIDNITVEQFNEYFSDEERMDKFISYIIKNKPEEFDKYKEMFVSNETLSPIFNKLSRENKYPLNSEEAKKSIIRQEWANENVKLSLATWLEESEDSKRVWSTIYSYKEDWTIIAYDLKTQTRMVWKNWAFIQTEVPKLETNKYQFDLQKIKVKNEINEVQESIDLKTEELQVINSNIEHKKELWITIFNELNETREEFEQLSNDNDDFSEDLREVLLNNINELDKRLSEIEDEVKLLEQERLMKEEDIDILENEKDALLEELVQINKTEEKQNNDYADEFEKIDNKADRKLEIMHRLFMDKIQELLLKLESTINKYRWILDLWNWSSLISNVNFKNWDFGVKDNDKGYKDLIALLNIIMTGDSKTPINQNHSEEILRDVNPNLTYTNGTMMFHEMIKSGVMNNMWTFFPEAAISNIEKNLKKND